MPLKTFEKAIQMQTPDFDRSLQSVQQIAQDFRTMALQKQKTEQQFENRKALYEMQQQGRIELQEDREEFQREVQGIEASQARVEAFNESFTEAREGVKAEMERVTNNFSDLSKYNLDTIMVQPKIRANEETGLYEVGYYDNVSGEYVSGTQFEDRLTRLQDVMDWINRGENMNLAEGMGETETRNVGGPSGQTEVQRLGQQGFENVVTQFKRSSNDPQTIAQLYQSITDGQMEFLEASESKTGGAKLPDTLQLRTRAQNIMGGANKSTLKLDTFDQAIELQGKSISQQATTIDMAIMGMLDIDNDELEMLKGSEDGTEVGAYTDLDAESQKEVNKLLSLQNIILQSSITGTEEGGMSYNVHEYGFDFWTSQVENVSDAMYKVEKNQMQSTSDFLQLNDQIIQIGQ